MPETVSFLDTTFKDLRCQNPVCQAQATHKKRITLRALLFDGWECHYCKLVHTGALAIPSLIPVLPQVDESGEIPDINFYRIDGGRVGEELYGETGPQSDGSFIVEPEPLVLVKNKIIGLLDTDGPLYMSDIAGRLDLGLEMTVNLCKELEDDGLVQGHREDPSIETQLTLTRDEGDDEKKPNLKDRVLKRDKKGGK